MRSLITFCLSLFLCAGANAQIYTQNFNTGSAADWTLMSSELGGSTSTADNQWLINSVYAAGPLGTATPSQPSGITGSPNSNYMHVNCGPTFASLYGSNCNFQAGGATTNMVSAMNTPISTLGYTGVNFNFWWLCEGNASASYGNVYYRTSTSGSWTMITTPITNYNLTSNWTSQSIHLAAFDNQATLEFAFQFTAGATGNDPAFGVDEITVTGTPSASVPTPSFTATPNPVCQDSCITFTNTTVGAVDSIRWMIVGAPYTSTVTPAYQLCIPSIVPAGPYTMRLYVFKGGAVDSVDHTFTVNPAPHPVIIRTLNTFSVTGSYTGYQWYNGTTKITGATNSGYTTTVKGSYSVVVDSGGCKGTATFSTLAVGGVNADLQAFWIDQNGGNAIRLYAAAPLDEQLNVSVFDATGRNVLSEAWNIGATDKQIDAGFYAPGLYYIKVTGHGSSTTLRWLKQ